MGRERCLRGVAWPGDGVGYEPARGVVINEFLAHTDLPLRDAIELFNTADISLTFQAVT